MIELLIPILIGGYAGVVAAWWALWFYERPELTRRILWGVQKTDDQG